MFYSRSFYTGNVHCTKLFTKAKQLQIKRQKKYLQSFISWYQVFRNNMPYACHGWKVPNRSKTLGDVKWRFVGFQIEKQNFTFFRHFPPIFRHFTNSVTFSVTKIFPPTDFFFGHFWGKWRKNLTHGHYGSKGCLLFTVAGLFSLPQFTILLLGRYLINSEMGTIEMTF